MHWGVCNQQFILVLLLELIIFSLSTTQLCTAVFMCIFVTVLDCRCLAPVSWLWFWLNLDRICRLTGKPNFSLKNQKTWEACLWRKDLWNLIAVYIVTGFCACACEVWMYCGCGTSDGTTSSVFCQYRTAYCSTHHVLFLWFRFKPLLLIKCSLMYEQQP